MRTSDTIEALAMALAKAQGELKNIEKGKINPHLKSKYADIADGLEVMRPVLSANGIALIQATQFNQDTGIFMLHTRLLHRSGQWIESTYPLPTGVKATDMGSAITYARRYAAFALVGVAGANEDDDGTAANAAPPVKMSAKKVPLIDKEELLAKAQETAAKGTDALREWWTQLPQKDRASLTAEEINDLKAAAAQISAGEPE